MPHGADTPRQVVLGEVVVCRASAAIPSVIIVQNYRAPFVDKRSEVHEDPMNRLVPIAIYSQQRDALSGKIGDLRGYGVVEPAGNDADIFVREAKRRDGCADPV